MTTSFEEVTGRGPGKTVAMPLGVRTATTTSLGERGLTTRLAAERATTLYLEARSRSEPKTEYMGMKATTL